MSGSGGDVLNALAHPAQINLLSAYGDAARTADAIWRNRMWQAKQAAGEAQSTAIDPNGVYQPNVALQNLAQTGSTGALAAPETLSNSQALSDAQLAQGLKSASFINQASGAALAQGDFSDHAMSGIIRQATGAGFSLPQIQQAFQGLPPESDPAARKAWLEQHRDTSAGWLQQFELQHGITGSELSPTGERVGTKTSPQTGVVSQVQSAGVPIAVTPPDQLVQIGTNPDGSKRMGLQRQAVAIANGSGAPSPLGNGRLPPALRNPNAPASTGGGLTYGVGPAKEAAMAATGDTSAKAFSGYADDMDKAQGQRAILGNMLADTTQFTTGPGAAKIQKVRELAGRFGIPIDKDATSASESFSKFAAQLAQSQGASSDARLGVNLEANPHADLSPGGVDLILRQLQGNADYIAARSQLAAKWPDKSDKAGFVSSIGTNLDPRAFQWARMTPEQKVKYADSLSATDAKAVRSAYNFAHSNGLLP